VDHGLAHQGDIRTIAPTENAPVPVRSTLAGAEFAVNIIHVAHFLFLIIAYFSFFHKPLFTGFENCVIVK
jgi:hypothetical protein